jgi:hypothetical protein
MKTLTLQEAINTLSQNPNEYISKEDTLRLLKLVSTPLDSGWIPVSERLPEDERRVLCFTTSRRMVENSYSEYSDQDSNWFKRVFTHWQPLPPSPTVEQNK